MSRTLFIKLPIYRHEGRFHLVNISRIECMSDCEKCTVITMYNGDKIWTPVSVEYINTLIELEQAAAGT